MGKRHVVIVSSSDDEDGDRSGSATCSSFKSKLVTSVSQKKCKSSKVIDSNDRSYKRSRKVEKDNFDTLFEDFCEDLHGFNGDPAERKRKDGPDSGWRDTKELWVDKYRPRSLAELAVHKKKIEEVKVWLEERLGTSKATIHVIASQLGAELCEWRTPTPTLWQEHLYNTNSGLRYMSKLDEFETFVERIRKYSLLPLAYTGGSKKSIILLIDDLPVTNGRVAYGRLSKCLHFLAQSTQIPTVISITEYCKVDSGDSTNYLEELQSSLERAGASKVAFNPLTVNSIKKSLSRICGEEQCNVSGECVDQIAKSSGGDIRHAITSLQYFCLRPDLMLSLPLSALSITHSKGKEDVINSLQFPSAGCEADLDDKFLLPFGRDETLSLFHALGKFLHNKRETVSAAGSDPFLLQERFVRFPLKMDAPEKVLSQAHGQARRIADFLHENVLDFLSEEAIDDAWSVASYLSDADCFLNATLHRPISRMITGTYDQLENVAELVAASVAVRGVMFGNSHPSPSRWHSIRSPKLWQVEQSYRHNKNQMVVARLEAYNSFGSSGLSVMATEYKPALKWLRFRASEDPQVHKKPIKGRKAESDYSNQMVLDELKAESSAESEGDEIEDW
ncbi:cell cycle checkpoint protein RAD17 isoform X2 [Magnolia sinica]|uniref:cell cycle checkpoint protein RAD17 isoform X2 n=1 Tax=Magnolia sinica TaxID=86752 RepID=UPI002658E6E5|nr:cell cycle checkpoint protein RAD17 isoform X2 [Magnolia sinica]